MERMGIPLPPDGPNAKTNAVVLMNAAVDAADGKSYLPYETEMQLRKSLTTAEARVRELEAIVAEAAKNLEMRLRDDSGRG